MAETLLKNFARQDSLYSACPRYVYIPTMPFPDLEFEIGSISLDASEKESVSEEELECSWTDEIYNLIVDNLKAAEAVTKIVMAIPREGLFRIWTVVGRDDDRVRNRIYERERAVIESLSVFDVDVDFYVATEDMMDAFMDDEAIVIYSRPLAGRQM